MARGEDGVEALFNGPWGTAQEMDTDRLEDWREVCVSI